MVTAFAEAFHQAYPGAYWQPGLHARPIAWQHESGIMGKSEFQIVRAFKISQALPEHLSPGNDSSQRILFQLKSGSICIC